MTATRPPPGPRRWPSTCSGPAGTAEAADWWWRAADRARELYAHAEEYAHLRKADALGYPAVTVAVALGDAATMLGRYREALAEFEAAAAGRPRAWPGAATHSLGPRGHRAQAGRGAPPAG